MHAKFRGVLVLVRNCPLVLAQLEDCLMAAVVVEIAVHLWTGFAAGVVSHVVVG